MLPDLKDLRGAVQKDLRLFSCSQAASCPTWSAVNQKASQPRFRLVCLITTYLLTQFLLCFLPVGCFNLSPTHTPQINSITNISCGNSSSIKRIQKTTSSSSAVSCRTKATSHPSGFKDQTKEYFFSHTSVRPPQLD